jgi:hypothetical protein
MEGRGVTTIDLHPEDMLDAARRGTLAPAGVEDLRAHLGRCVACRMSLTLPDDLQVEAAVKDSDALLTTMVRGAMAGERIAHETRAYRARASGTGRRVAVALALLFAGGSGGAAVWSMGGATLARRFVPEILQLPRHRDTVHVPSAPHPTRLAISVEPVSAPAPVLAPAHPQRVRVSPPALPRASADELFVEANRARRAGDYPLALRRYTDLRRSYPGSREELTARVVVGDLLLAEGPTRDALASFDSYLAASPDGILAEEALVGRASALMRLGRRDEERGAWAQLLRLHPDSVQGARARRRLAELR